MSWHRLRRGRLPAPLLQPTPLLQAAHTTVTQPHGEEGSRRPSPRRGVLDMRACIDARMDNASRHAPRTDGELSSRRVLSNISVIVHILVINN